MGNDSKFEISDICRGFGETEEEVFNEKLKIAKKFIEKFVERVATPKSVDESDEAWTQSVRRRFIEICPGDCYAYPNDHLTANGEYLVNYTWVEKGKAKRVLLAAESAWGTGLYGRAYWSLVEQEFEKLLAIKAPYKVFIFSSCCNPGKPDLRPEVDFSFEHAKGKIEASLENYGHHIPGEVYIFLDLPQTGIKNGNGKYRSCIWIDKKLSKRVEKFEVGDEYELKRPTEFEAQWR